MKAFILIVAIFLSCMPFLSSAFSGSVRSISRGIKGMRMEYIPDGLTKQQWEAIKKKEGANKDL